MRYFSFIIFLIFLFPGLLFAQDSGQLGCNIKINSSKSIGIIYHITDIFAFRPSISYNRSTSETAVIIRETKKIELDKSSYAGSLSAIIYVSSQSEFRAYMGVDALYSKSTEETPFIRYDAEIDILKSDSYNFTLSGLFGLQYELNNHLSVYGELGVGYSSGENSSGLSNVDLSTKEISLINSGIGIIFYFK
jgi:opacity protein-like surface antigen